MRLFVFSSVTEWSLDAPFSALCAPFCKQGVNRIQKGWTKGQKGAENTRRNEAKRVHKGGKEGKERMYKGGMKKAPSYPPVIFSLDRTEKGTIEV